MNSWGDRLKQCLEIKGVTQEGVAKECGLTQSTLSRYLSGSPPKAMELYRLSVYFGVSMEWLLVGDDERDQDALRVQEKAIPYQARSRERLREILREMESLSERVRQMDLFDE